MENIRQALERARALNVGGLGQARPTTVNSLRQPFDRDFASKKNGDGRDREITLDISHLESNRIIAYDETDPRTKSFDMLRTQVLQSMDQKNWNLIGITSPSPGCGKTVTAVNLAFSVARQPERSVLLVDMDFQKPRVTGCIGVHCENGLVSVLEGRTILSNAVFQARVGKQSIPILPVESSTSGSSALIASRAMSVVLQEIKRDYRSHTVIFDLPPMLSSDDVIAILPQLDCLLLVAAVGKTTVAEIDECNKHLQSTDVVRLVLNKATESTAKYYNYY